MDIIPDLQMSGLKMMFQIETNSRQLKTVVLIVMSNIIICKNIGIIYIIS